jgi:UDP-2,3-diacylglucosamine pyrophosphatase LpxH
MKPHYRTVFLSDVRLGSPEDRAADLAALLNNMTCGELYIVGNLFADMKPGMAQTLQTDACEVSKALYNLLDTTPVTYVLGDLDKPLRALVGEQLHPNLTITDEAVHTTLDRHHLVLSCFRELTGTKAIPYTVPSWTRVGAVVAEQPSGGFVFLTTT